MDKEKFKSMLFDMIWNDYDAHIMSKERKTLYKEFSKLEKEFRNIASEDILKLHLEFINNMENYNYYYCKDFLKFTIDYLFDFFSNITLK